MNVKYMFSLLAVIILFLIAYVGVEVTGLYGFFGIFVPYLALLFFIVGFIYRVVNWAYSPVPFRIPTTCGQEKSLPWVRTNCIDNPFTTGSVIVRMFLEVVFFRSLFRNLVFDLKGGKKLIYRWEIWLWVAALAFHWSFFTVVFRHLRFFTVTEPVLSVVQAVEYLDSFFRIEFMGGPLQIGLPGVFMSGLVLLIALIYLLLRRILLPQVRYISLSSDFFPLFLIGAIAISGIMMRYFVKTDIVAVKEFTMSLVTFQPQIPQGIGAIFFVHLFLVCVLLVYFPFSKLMHLGGIFMSPTRNLANNSRAQRHVNPWNYPVHVHTYEEYEEEFREKMIEAGLPVEKEMS